MVSRCQAAIREAGRVALWEPGAAPGRGLGRALYAAAWYCLHLGHFAVWLHRKSTDRRWAPGSGNEWRILRAAGSYTAAHHCLRLLTDGLPGPARWRSGATRRVAPRTCVVCGSAAAHAWATPTEDDDGLAWCGVCFGPWAAGNAWAALPPALLPAGLHASAADLASARRGLVGHGGWPVSRYGQCPLCSLGEAGAEHLLLWCPAVALAWNAWGRLAAVAPCGPASGASATAGQGPSVLEAVRQAHGDVAYLATFLHQVAFLYSTLLGRACLEPERAAAWLIRACSRGSSDEESCDGAGLTLEGGLGEVEPHAWASDPPDCDCGAGPGAACGVVSDAAPARTATGDFGGGRMVRWPVTRRSVEAGGCIGRLYASAAVAACMSLGLAGGLGRTLCCLRRVLCSLGRSLWAGPRLRNPRPLEPSSGLGRC